MTTDTELIPYDMPEEVFVVDYEHYFEYGFSLPLELEGEFKTLTILEFDGEEIPEPEEVEDEYSDGKEESEDEEEGEDEWFVEDSDDLDDEPITSAPSLIVSYKPLLDWTGRGELGKRNETDYGYGQVKVIEFGHRQRLSQFFPNTTEYLNYITSPCEIENDKRLSHQAVNAWDNSTLSWDQCIELARRGWPEGVERANRIKEKIQNVILNNMPVPEVHYDVTGENLDIGKYVEGQPEDYMIMVDTAKTIEAPSRKMVHIVTTVDIAGKEAFITRGAAIAALVQLLELHNTRCLVDVHIGTNDKIDTVVRVKEAEWPVNIENLVFYTAHPCMFSRLSYSAWEHAGKEWRGNVGTGSWGWISEPREEDRGDVYVSALGSAWISKEETALKWVKDQMARAGIQVEIES